MLLGFILLIISIFLFALSLRVLLLSSAKYAKNHAAVKALKLDPTGEVDMQNVKRCLSVDKRNGEIITTKKSVVDTH